MNKKILEKFIAGEYKQVFCEKCELTFLTNVYMFDDTHVLLEKRSLGLEYYSGAIYKQGLTKVPNIQRIGILDEENNIIETPPSQEEIYSGKETDLVFIYVMERLNHLDNNDTDYFNRFVKDLEWQNDKDRSKIIAGVTKRYNVELAQDISKLYEYYKLHEGVLAWDLHGDNLMERLESNEIIILDPYTRRA